MKENLHPSLLRGFSAKASTVVPWSTVIDYVTGGTLRELTEQYRHTRQAQCKARLLSITPNCQLNGRGKEATDVVGLTGVAFIDIDNIPPEYLESVRALVNDDPHTFFSKASVSGQGLHILVRWSVPDAAKGMSMSEQYALAFLTVNCYYADLTGYAFDEKCSNVNRLMALNHDDKAHFNSQSAVFELSPNLTPCDDSAPAAAPTERAVDYAVRIVERHGDSYYPGNRHNYLLKCLSLMNKLGVAQSEAEGWALAFDLGEREIRTLAKSVYNLYAYQHGTYDVPVRRTSREFP